VTGATELPEPDDGDDPDFEDLLVAEMPALRAFVRLRCGDRIRALESSSDLVQSVCREIWRDRGDFEYRGRAAFRRWLFLAAARKIADRGRRLDRRPQPVVPDASASDALLDRYRTLFTPSAIAMREEGIAAAEAAFDRLPDEHREAILLCRVAGLTQAEAAEQMGRTEEAVRKLVSRGLAKLSLLMDGGA
jgi:RNA polymerase sigma-70 factor (ECF subfamily)